MVDFIHFRPEILPIDLSIRVRGSPFRVLGSEFGGSEFGVLNSEFCLLPSSFCLQPFPFQVELPVVPAERNLRWSV